MARQLRTCRGDYWTVRPGATIQVKVLSELAVLETIVAAKP
jgi:hypothetical protein